jgi:hypothetical protein
MQFRAQRFFPDMRYLKRFTTVAGLLTAILGCASSSPLHPGVGAGRSPVSETVSQDSVNPRPSLYLIYQPGQLRYHVQISSAVQLAVGDSTHRVDSTRIIGSLRVRFTATSPREEIRAEVQPDSLSLTVGSGTSVPLVPGSVVAFRIDPRVGRITPNDLPENTVCGRAGSHESPFSGREVLPSMQPRDMNTWVDTSTSRTCRDSVLLLVTRIASYVRLQSLDSAQRFVRSTQVTVSGTGYQWGQKVDVTGDGTAVDTLRINGFPLRLQESAGSSLLRLQFRAPLKTQEFIQSTRTHVFLER